MELFVNSNGKSDNGSLAAAEQLGRSDGIAFDSAEVRAGPTLGDGLFLVVSGPVPDRPVQIKLRPVLSDLAPEYRRIEIVSETQPLDRFDRDKRGKKYERSMPLSGLSGTKGIELVGSNGTRKFDLINR